ncbi:MAG: O-antigen ligase family protein [Patescibacteria group bacterium]|mgnify:CR=1 FL=1
MQPRAVEKAVAGLVKIGLWLIPFIPLIVSPSMLFPFITGKNFTFRIAIGILFVFWTWLAVARPEYRPKGTPVFKAATIFIAVLFLADILSPNPYRAFFANYERMEGFMMLGHLYLYFVMLGSMFRSRRDWLIFFHATLAASVIVSYIGLLQKFGVRVSLQGGFRVDSTIGNPTYLAAYLMFHVWLLLMLIHRFWEKWWLRMVYGAVLAFELAILYFTATRGAVLALVVVSVLLVGSLAFFWRRAFPRWPSGRKFAIAAFAAVLLVPLVFWQLRSAPFVQQSEVLRRLTNYSFTEGTIQARFKIWNMSWRGFRERPILGWGQENYYLVFQKFYNPGLFGDEPWFDRSHNVFFDWLIHAGIAGLVGYLSLVASAFAMIFSMVRKNSLSFWEAAVLSGMFLAHFFQNVFVFENLNTYFLFFTFLAYVHRGGMPDAKAIAQLSGRASPHLAGRAYALSCLALGVFLIGGYQLHVKPIRESKALIHALSANNVKELTADAFIAVFQRALSYQSFGDTEVREQLVNLARNIPDDSRFKAEDKKRIIDFALEEMRKEVATPAPDVKHYLFLGALLSRAGRLDGAYLAEAEKVLGRAKELSPTKQPVYFELAQLYLSTNRIDDAVKELEDAWNLDRRFSEAGVNVWLVGILANRDDIIVKMRKEFPPERMSADGLRRLAGAAQNARKFALAEEFYSYLVRMEPENADYRVSYAALLGFAGKYDEARKQAEEARHLKPDLATQIDEFLKTLK